MNAELQIEKAKRFHDLHYAGKMLILPNIWDTLGALLLESLKYPAIATASAAIAYTNGKNDGEQMLFSDVLSVLKKIATSVDIPLTADIESGYAENDTQLQQNIKLIIETGIVGINIEDTNKRTKEFFTIEAQCHRIRLIKKAAGEMGIPIFINARTDIFFRHDVFSTPELKIDEAIKRGTAYKDAGADCFFPITLIREEDIQQLVNTLNMPINVLLIPGIPDLNTLCKMGVARASLGPSFLKIAIKSMRDLALQLKEYKGLPAITGNDITTDYLKNLVNKNYLFDIN